MKRAKSGVFAGELTQPLRSGKILLSPGTFLDILGNYRERGDPSDARSKSGENTFPLKMP